MNIDNLIPPFHQAISGNIELWTSTKPFEHQTKIIEGSWALENYALFMSQGSGKSLVAINTAANLFRYRLIDAMLIIAPKSLCLTWAREQIPQHFGGLTARSTIHVWRPSPGKKLAEKQDAFLGLHQPEHLRVLIMNVDAFATDKGKTYAQKFLEGSRCLMVVDESTTIKSPTAKRAKAITKLGRLARYRRILTGTPAANSPLDVFQQVEFLSPGYLAPSYHVFQARYAVLRERLINGRRFKQIVGYQRLEELMAKLASISCRVLKEDCLDLPPKVYQTRYVELSAEQRRLYEQMRLEAVAVLSEAEIVTANLALTAMLRLRQILSGVFSPDFTEASAARFFEETNPRLEAVVDEVRASLENGEKVIVWEVFTKSLEAIVARLDKEFGAGTAFAYHGATAAEDRQKAVEQFQDMASPLRVLVIQPRTGSYGLTATAASKMVYCSNDWSLEMRLQSEDRAHRIGQTKTVVYVDLIAEGTIDEKVVAALRSKKQLADLVTGDAWRTTLSAPLED